MGRRRSKNDGGLLVAGIVVIVVISWIVDFVKANQDAVIGFCVLCFALVIVVFIVQMEARRRARAHEAEERQWRANLLIEQTQQRANLLIEQTQRRRNNLLGRYGDAVVVDAIMAGDIWHDMTKEQLIESWGPPEDVKTETLKTKTKEEYKYDCVGVNRFLRRAYLENDVVVGWKR